jgi:hypothetical protein
MNTFFAASLLDSPWGILVIVVVGALSNWLMKRRQRSQADERQDSDEPVPTAAAHEPARRQLDLQEILRPLLGGEPPPRVPGPPPSPPVLRDAQQPEGWPDEEQCQPEQGGLDEPQETYEAARPSTIQPAPPSWAHSALTRANAPRIEASETHERAACRFEQLNEQGKYSPTVTNPGRGRRSRENTGALGLFRGHRKVRQAFVASLVFGPPKAFES